MKKGILILAVIALMAVSCGAYAVSAGVGSFQLYGWYNQIAAPIIPFDPNPRNVVVGSGVFGGWDPGVPPDPPTLGGWYNGMAAGDFITYLDPTSQNSLNFPNPDWDSFPNILMGDGYIATVALGIGETDADRYWEYDGVDISDTDVWISLPGTTGGSGGWHYVGIPYPVGTSVDFATIIITNGVDSYNMVDMYAEGAPDWVSLTWFGDDAAAQNTIRIPDDGVFTLDGGKMYQVYTKVNNLALILPSPL